MTSKKNTKQKKMEDYEVIAFIVDYYPHKASSVSKLIKILRKKVGRSCSEERFKSLFQKYLRNYASQILINK